jgi:hypothetical protein
MLQWGGAQSNGGQDLVRLLGSEIKLFGKAKRVFDLYPIQYVGSLFVICNWVLLTIILY